MRGELLQRRDLALLVLLVALAGNYVLGPLPFSLPGAHYSGKSYARSGHAKVLDEAVATIPDDAVVVGEQQRRLAPLGAPRRLRLPGVRRAPSTSSSTSARPGFYDRINEQLHQAVLGRIVLDQRYQSVYARDDVYVFKLVDPRDAGGRAGSEPGAAGEPRRALPRRPTRRARTARSARRGRRAWRRRSPRVPAAGRA